MSKTFADSTYSGGSRSSCSIFDLAGLQVALQLGARGADLVGPAERPHPLLAGPLGDGGGAVSTAGAIGGGDYTRRV